MNGSLTLEMVYHPSLAIAFSRFQYLSFLLTSLLFGLATFVILKKSTSKMKFYKYLIINQLLWSYLFDAHMTIWQPVLLFPFFLCYSSGPAQYFSYHAAHPLCATLILIIAGMFHSIYSCLVYRVVSIFYESSVYKLVTSKEIFIKVYLLTLGMALFVGNIPGITWLFTPLSHETIRMNVIKDEPIFAEIIKLEPSTGGCDWEQCKYMILSGGIVFVTTLVLITLSVPFLFYIYTKQFIRVKSKILLNTAKLFTMLTKALLVQSLLGIVMILVPFLFFGIMFYTHNSRGSFYGQFVFFPVNLHSFFETVALLYMVKPYRRYVWYLTGKIMNKYMKIDTPWTSIGQNTSTSVVYLNTTHIPTEAIITLKGWQRRTTLDINTVHFQS